MTKIVRQGTNRAFHSGRTERHAQRTPLPPKVEAKPKPKPVCQIPACGCTGDAHR